MVFFGTVLVVFVVAVYLFAEDFALVEAFDAGEDFLDVFVSDVAKISTPTT